jgi:hypothetical protein
MRKFFLGTLMNLIAVLVLVGCTYGNSMRTSSSVYPPTNSQSVAVLWEAPNRPYEVIGLCSVLGAQFSSEVQMLRKLQKAAADLGADAVIVKREGSIKRSFIAGSGGQAGWGLMGGTDEFPKNLGEAIKFK